MGNIEDSIRISEAPFFVFAVLSTLEKHFRGYYVIEQLTGVPADW